MKEHIKKTFAVVVSIAMVVCMLANVVPVQADGNEYEIYPNPQKITYNDGDFILRDNVNVIYEDGIDSYTQARLKEATDLKNLSISSNSVIDSGKTNILVGIKGSNGYVDQYVSQNCSYDNSLFDQIDAYYLSVNNGTIVVLGKDTDAAFYGLTTLYMIFKQIDSRTVRNFVVEDYADVASRGFIEGYYGNPWSTEDRVNLMTWSGYYKLNSYFYAPKDDPKHNSKWRELYTNEELESKIKPLAEAGNQSKCRFVFALHPFMNNPISFTNANYKNDLAALQAKFDQVIKAGVRQIAILADDAANFNNTGDLGGNNYQRLLEDMTEWLKEKQKDYPDLKLTLPFCPVEYGGYGENYYSSFPDNVQIVMTGGKVWGEVSNNFTKNFTNNVKRGPYMWINWPCTDNSKKHLIMGGYDTFLQPGVNPDNIQGIVLNPMQQSEPSKVAIFGNACYTWNIWETKDMANQAWEDSFKYVDHNSPLETDASNALKELSKHMINQNMDSRVTVLQESVDLKDKLNAFKEKLSAGTVTENDIEAMIDEFEILQNASKTYRQQAGNKNISNQIVYWLDCWDDTTEAAIAYLQGVKAVFNNDTNGIIKYNSAGESAFSNSKTHGFHYVDHNEYAEVGVQHIVPFIKTIASYVSQHAQVAMDPDKVVATFITNRQDTPTGSTDNVFDKNDSTMASYRNPIWIHEGDYVGVKYNKSIAVNNIRFLLGNGKNHFEASKLQYTTDGEKWKDLQLTQMNNAFTGIQNQYLEINVKKENLPADFQAMGIRLIATADNKLDAYLNVHEIQINNAKTDDETNAGEYSTNLDRMNNTDFAVLSDGQNGNSSDSEVWIAEGSGTNKDKTPAGSYIQYSLGSKQNLMSVQFAQGGSKNDDVITDGSLQYLDDEGNWQTIESVNNQTTQSFDLSDKNISTSAVRIYNNKFAGIWWRIGEFKVVTTDNTPIQYNIIRTERWTVYNDGKSKEENLYDGNDATYVWYDPDGSGNTTGDDALVDDYIGYDLGKVATLTKVHIAVGTEGKSDKIVNYTIETSLDNDHWTPIDGYANYTGKSSGTDVLDIALNNVNARYIRIRNLKTQESWIIFSEFTVEERSADGSEEYLFTNLDSSPLLSNLKDGQAWLTPGKVTLEKGQYIGLDLKNIKRITNIEGQYDNLKLQVSKNTVEWTDYDTASSAEKEIDARYIRIYNDGTQTKELDLDKLLVTFEYVGDKSVTSDFACAQTNDDMRTNDAVNNVFDGNLSTLGMINGAQEKGKHIVFDLGQTIHFESIRYYVVETQLNYLRDADFEVSVDGKKWTKVLHVGKEVPNKWDETVAKDMQDKTLYHDSKNPGYMYKEATDLNVDGRYIRVTPTSTYSHRWVAFNEIMINGGAYISPESNKDIISDDIEEKNKIPSNMIDKDFSTAYKSSAKNSSFTYYVSEPVNKRTVRIVQSGAVSFAKVTAEIYDHGDIKEIELGTLNQTISEFTIPEDKMIKDIKVSWEENIPEILEIALYENADDFTDAKKDLKKLIDTPVDLSSWTTSSTNDFNEAYAIALEIYNNKYASKNSVEMASGLLKSAINGGVEKYTDTKLTELVSDKVNNSQGYYTAATYNKYDSVINKAVEALKNIDDLSKEDGEKLVADIETALQGLTYSILYREQAQVLIEEDSYLDESLYSAESWKVYQQAQAQLSEAIKKDKAASSQEERVAPEEFEQLIQTYKNAKDQLALNAKGSIKDLISKIEKLDPEQYTKSSYQTLMAELDKAKATLENDDEAKIQMAFETLSAALNNLKESGQKEYEAYKAAIELLDSKLYTESSYKPYKDAYDQLMNLGNDVSKEDFMKAKTLFEEAKEGLLYKSADYSKLQAILNKVPQDLSGFDQELVKQLNDKIAGIDYDLTIVDQKTVDQYANDIEVLLDQVLKSLNSSIEVTEVKPSKVTYSNATTGDTTTVLPQIITLVISLGVFLLLKRRKRAD